jgi:arginase
VPGAGKAPEALREAGLHRRLGEGGAIDAGVVLSGRYVDDDDTRAAGHVRNEAGLVTHARNLATRLTNILDAGQCPLVIGGDCSVLVGIDRRHRRPGPVLRSPTVRAHRSPRRR